MDRLYEFTNIYATLKLPSKKLSDLFMPHVFVSRYLAKIFGVQIHNLKLPD